MLVLSIRAIPADRDPRWTPSASLSADVGYSPSEVVVREVHEETGVHCVPERLVAVVDGLRAGYTRSARATVHGLALTRRMPWGRSTLPSPRPTARSSRYQLRRVGSRCNR